MGTLMALPTQWAQLRDAALADPRTGSLDVWPDRPGAWAVGALALFAVVTLDTALRGPLTAGVEGLNDAVASWRDAGVPVHTWGRLLSHVGEYAVCGAMPLLAAGLAFAQRRAAWGWSALASLAVGAAAEWVAQQALTGLNRPMPRLDPYLVPDTVSPLRENGLHLYPSGHELIATLGWGWLFLVAAPLAAQSLGWASGPRSWLRRAAVAAWGLACVLVAAGRILRQAHGYNDVLAGWALGAAALFGGLWVRRPIEAALRRRRAARQFRHGGGSPPLHPHHGGAGSAPLPADGGANEGGPAQDGQGSR